MKRSLHTLTLILLAALVACQVPSTPPVTRPPQRIESAVGGPERVFARPVAEILPALQNARASGPNGRVGPELVFWGYELAQNRPAVLVACAVIEGVDCAARLQQVCRTGRAEVLASQQEPGEVRYRTCEAIGVAMPGDLSPTCNDTEETQTVELTLLSCN